MIHKKFISIFLSIFLLISLFPTYHAVENNTITVENYGLIEDPYERLGAGFIDDTVELSTSYDPRECGYATVTKNQNPYKLCWMYATIGAAEQYISRNYGAHFDISEAHGAVAYSNSIIPQEYEGYKGYYTNNANYGNFTSTAIQYLSNWNQPLLKNNSITWNSMVLEDNYSKGELNQSYGVQLSENFSTAKSIFNLTGAKHVKDSINSIKYAIKNYGGVITDLYITPSLINQDSNNEYNLFYEISDTENDDVIPNHSIVLVGWDDNYSKDNFSESHRPSNNGAWLVRNSWYSNDSANYIWVSYEHASLHSTKSHRIAITDMQEADDNEYMLSYDYKTLGSNDPAYNETVYLCNVFDIENYTNVFNRITKVMLYLKTTGCNYRVRIVQLDSNNNLPTNLDNIGVLATGSYNGEGYITVNLNNEYEFINNNKCAVIVELIPDSPDSEISIPCVAKPPSTISSNESFYGFDTDNNQISWTDCYDNISSNGNLCIRPVLCKSIANDHYANISPSQVISNNQDSVINIDTDSILLYIRTKNYIFLREKLDYIKSGNNIILKKEFIASLNGKYTELLFNFTNGITKTVVINPKSTITNVNISGNPIVGNTLNATCVGSPEKVNYDVNYQWQVSVNGTSWFDITNANSNTYTISNNEYDLFIRVKVTSNNQYGNVVYPLEKCSISTKHKVVILGDVDLNGTVNTNDATLLSKYLAELATLNERQLLTADANKDGVINVNDVRCIQQIASS